MTPNSILVVDDDEDIRDMIVYYLEGEGFSTHQAGNGDAALKYIESVKPDLILLDIEMPGENGLELCRILKARPSTSDIPVIIVSGSTSRGNILTAYLVGAGQFLSKPFALSTLGKCVNNALYHSAASA